jgi:hypothetical protein
MRDVSLTISPGLAIIIRSETVVEHTCDTCVRGPLVGRIDRLIYEGVAEIVEGQGWDFEVNGCGFLFHVLAMCH